MFVLQPKPTFTLDLTVTTPGGGEGKFKGIFKHKTRTEVKELFGRMTDKKSPLSDLDALMEIMDGWEGVDQKFSKESVEMLLENYFNSGLEIMQAYNDAVFEIKRKN